MKLKEKINEVRWRERMTHPGRENPDKTFYVIRRHAERAGLFSFVATNLGSVREAVDREMVPVIDMQNSRNAMLEPEQVGNVNAWEQYFVQPAGYSLSDIRHAANVYLGPIVPPGGHGTERYPDYNMLLHPEELAMWRGVASRYLHLLPQHERDAEDYVREHFAGQRVLGVLCRGTDYLREKPFNHPIQPKTEAVIEKCKEVMGVHKCDMIYLCTEDRAIYDQISAAFPGRIMTRQKLFVHIEDGQNINTVSNRLEKPYERNRDYLISIAVLSRCSCLVAGAAGGTYGALLMTKGYDYEYVFTIGRYQTQEPKPGSWEYLVMAQ